MREIVNVTQRRSVPTPQGGRGGVDRLSNCRSYLPAAPFRQPKMIAHPAEGQMPLSTSSQRSVFGSSEGKKNAQSKTTTKLLVAMTGKASPAKAATGDEPVFAYIASLPQPQRGIAERIDALAAKTLPDIRRGEVGHGVLRRGRGLVLLIRRLRRPCEIDVHARHRDQAGTACDADRDGQVHRESSWLPLTISTSANWRPYENRLIHVLFRFEGKQD